MLRGEVQYCLEHYRECVARSKFLKTEIENLQSLMQKLKDSEIIDSIQITQKWTGMPHGNVVGDPTGQLAQRIADGQKPKYLQELEEEIAKKQEEYNQRRTLIAYVDSWLCVLNERERYVMTAFCLEGATWREVAAGFENKFGDHYSLQGIRKIRLRAFTKICEIAD